MTSGDTLNEVKGAFEGVAGTLAAFAALHFGGLIALQFLPPGIEHAVSGAASGAADVIKETLSAVGIGSGAGLSGIAPLEEMVMPA